MGKRFKFAEYIFDADKLELWKDGNLVTLKLQPARLLLILLENAPATVSRQTIQNQIWDNGTTVEFDHGLNACVNQLRSALGDTASNPQFIITLPKRGYRFVTNVEHQTPTKNWMPTRRVAATVCAVVAVLLGVLVLFGKDGPEPSTTIYVAPIAVEGEQHAELDGIVQYALRLGTVDRLTQDNLEIVQVLNGESLWKDFDPRRSDLKIDYSLFISILENSKNDYAVEAKVVNAGSGSVVDTQSFMLETLDANSLSLLSDQIAIWSGRLFGSTQSSIQRIYPQHGSDYYDAMIRARRHFQLAERASIKESLKWFDAALKVSPNSVDALGGKAMALAVLAGGDGFPTSETYSEALSLADKIRIMAGPTAQSELARGFIFLYHDWDIERSRRAFDLAMELAPGDAVVRSWRAGVLAAQGESGLAAVEADAAVQLDPMSMSISADRCWYLGAADRFEEAISACSWALELDPEHMWSLIGMVSALEKLGRYEEARVTLLPVAKTLIAQRSALMATRPAVDTPGELDLSSFQSVSCAVSDLLQPVAQSGQFPLFQMAAFEAQCGRFGRTLELLQQAREGGESGILFYAIDPRFDEFRASKISGDLDVAIKKRDAL